MRTVVTTLALTLALVAITAADGSAANPIGPFCFAQPPFSGIDVLFFDSPWGNGVVQGAGFSSVGGVSSFALNVSGFVSGNDATLVILAGDQCCFPVIKSVRINLGTGSGPGSCFALGTTPPPCGTGGTFTYTLTPCGTLAAASDARQAARLAGGLP